jgi:hypothetical protein
MDHKQKTTDWLITCWFNHFHLLIPLLKCLKDRRNTRSQSQIGEKFEENGRIPTRKTASCIKK